jgi:uncharacterized protein
MKLLNHPPGELAAKLQSYLDSDERLRAVFAYTKQRFHAASHLGAHNWEHAYRDVLNAIVIGEAEKADMSIVLPAAAMHDIGFLYGATGKTHGGIGAENLADFLREAHIDYPADMIEKMAACIRTHKGSMHSEKPESLEAKVVADADLLEKFGPFGIYSGLRTYSEFNYPLQTALDREQQVLDLTLETPTGHKIVESGRQFVSDFYKELREAAEAYANSDGSYEA